jgi:hypothetical protein
MCRQKGKRGMGRRAAYWAGGAVKVEKKKSLVEFFIIKAAFAAVTCHAKHGFSGQTPKKKKMKQQQR